MPTQIQQEKQIDSNGQVTTRTTRVEDAAPAQAPAAPARQEVPASRLAARIIWYIAGVLLVLLAFRFVLALLGANPSNQFANFIYSVSHPFVAPFFSLFGYDLKYGVSRFETFTLVAMLVYTVVAWGLARLFTLKRDAQTDV